MSNVIKASQISYGEDVRRIDFNSKADAIAQEFIDNYIADNIANKQIDFGEVSKKLEEERVLTPDDVDFTPGLVTEQVYLAPEEETEQPESEVLKLEARVREKKRELEELEDKLNAAKAEARDIIDNANSEAGRILENARAEAEEEKAQVFENAQQEGYSAGMSEAEDKVQQARAEAEALKEQYRQDFEKQVEELEPAFVEIVINYVRKLTGIYAEDKNDIILYLIDSAMKGRRGVENFIIRVSEADFAMASYSKDSIRGYLSEGSSVEVVADKVLTKNQCMIETESRIFDCSLDSQMLSLIEDIRLLAEKD